MNEVERNGTSEWRAVNVVNREQGDPTSHLNTVSIRTGYLRCPLPRSVSNPDQRPQFWTLYLTRFTEGFGFITLQTLLPTYINTLDPQATTIFGVTISAGLIIGMYTTGFTLAQTVTVVPLAWAGDRFDKRTILLVVLALGGPASTGSSR